MTAVAFNFPPLDYSLLFPDLVNFHMERNPSFPMFIYTSENISGALTQISFLEFGRAAHRVAHALRPNRQGSDEEVVMIIANTDTILHHAVLVGLSIAGWIVRSYLPFTLVFFSHSDLAIPGITSQFSHGGCQYDEENQLLTYCDPCPCSQIAYRRRPTRNPRCPTDFGRVPYFPLCFPKAWRGGPS